MQASAVPTPVHHHDKAEHVTFQVVVASVTLSGGPSLSSQERGTSRVVRGTSFSTSSIRRKPKGDGEKGTGKTISRQFATNITTLFDILRQFATFYDNFRLFVPLT